MSFLKSRLLDVIDYLENPPSFCFCHYSLAVDSLRLWLIEKLKLIY